MQSPGDELVPTVVLPDGREVVPGDAGFRVRLLDGAALATGRTVVADVAYEGAEPVGAAVRVTVGLGASTEPWWLVPGAFYGDNRPAENDRVFPRFEIAASATGDGDRMVSDWWEFRADRAATPAAFCWTAPGMGGAALATTETSPVGVTGVGFGHRDGEARLWLTFPFQEGPITYYGDAEPRPAESGEHVWQPGEHRRFEFTVHPLAADRHAYAPILRELHAAGRDSAPLRPWVDVEHAADLAAHGLLRWHYDPDPGVLLETVGFDREVTGRDGRTVDRQAMHVGWVSGIPWAYALLAHGARTGRGDEVAAARSVIDLIATNLSPSGTFWGVWYREHGWSQSWTPIKHGLHSRTLAEATLFLIRAAAVDPGRASWATAVGSNLDVIATRQREDGNLGSIHHAETGEVLSWSGASGLTWIAALVEAGSDRYLDVARRAGDYYARFVEAEYISGAPEDVDLAPTSEDGYAAVMAYVALHRATGEPRYLELARRAADWMLTFRYSYDVSFPEHTMLGRYDFGTRGADQASPSNQHLHAYGLVCTAELFELADATGDDHYRERAEETLACFRQFVAREDGDFNAYRGMVSERYYQTSCFQPKGMLLTLSHAWSVGVLLLGCEQQLARLG